MRYALNGPLKEYNNQIEKTPITPTSSYTNKTKHQDVIERIFLLKQLS